MPRGGLVKVITPPKAPDLDPDNPDTKKYTVYQFPKITAKGSPRSYFYKRKDADRQIELSQQPNFFLASTEAIAGDLLRLVFGVDFTPKVRVAIDPYQEFKPCVISKEIEFTAAAKLLPPKIDYTGYYRQQLITTQQRGLAKLLLTVFCFGEGDLHTHNWGIDQHSKQIVIIDHDRIFAEFSNQLHAKRKQFNHETSKTLLKQWPNLIYHPKEAFELICSEEILFLPLFPVSKPFNDPLYPFTSLQRKTLTDDKTFNQWKYFYLTKFLILLTDDTLDDIIQDHCVDFPECHVKEIELKKWLLDRKKSIQETLLSMPEYREFLKNHLQTLMPELLEEIKQYNQSFCDHHGNIKPKKAYRVIQIDSIKINLSRLCDLAKKEESVELYIREKRLIQIETQRIEREKNIFSYLNAAYITQLSNIDDLKALVQTHFSSIEILDLQYEHLKVKDPQKAEVLAGFYTNRHSFFNEGKTGKFSVGGILTKLEKSIEDYLELLTRNLDQHIDDTSRIACNLISSRQGKDHLQKQDLLKIWEFIVAFENYHFAVRFIITVMHHYSPDKIPNNIFQWLISKMALKTDDPCHLPSDIVYEELLGDENGPEFNALYERINELLGRKTQGISPISQGTSLLCQAQDFFSRNAFSRKKQEEKFSALLNNVDLQVMLFQSGATTAQL